VAQQRLDLGGGAQGLLFGGGVEDLVVPVLAGELAQGLELLSVEGEVDQDLHERLLT
jgi:hypothetical protein